MNSLWHLVTLGQGTQNLIFAFRALLLRSASVTWLPVASLGQVTSKRVAIKVMSGLTGVPHSDGASAATRLRQTGMSGPETALL